MERNPSTSGAEPKESYDDRMPVEFLVHQLVVKDFLQRIV